MAMNKREWVLLWVITIAMAGLISSRPISQMIPAISITIMETGRSPMLRSHRGLGSTTSTLDGVAVLLTSTMMGGLTSYRLMAMFTQKYMPMMLVRRSGTLASLTDTFAPADS